MTTKDRVSTLRGEKKKECFLSFAFFYTGGYLPSFAFNKRDWLNDIYWAASQLCNCAAAPCYHFEVYFSELIQLSFKGTQKNLKNSSDPLKFFKTPFRMMCIKRFKLNNYWLPLIPGDQSTKFPNYAINLDKHQYLALPFSLLSPIESWGYFALPRWQSQRKMIIVIIVVTTDTRGSKGTDTFRQWE